MGKIADILGEGDQDIMNLRAGISGLVFENWSNEQISELAVEMAQESRDELEKKLLQNPEQHN